MPLKAGPASVGGMSIPGGPVPARRTKSGVAGKELPSPAPDADRGRDREGPSGLLHFINVDVVFGAGGLVGPGAS